MKEQSASNRLGIGALVTLLVAGHHSGEVKSRKLDLRGFEHLADECIVDYCFTSQEPQVFAQKATTVDN